MYGKTISIVNQKGGVGKTTTAVNLATIFAIMNKKVLLLDLDSQGNASSGVGVNQKDRGVTVYNLLFENDDINRAVLKTEVPNLFVIPANTNLAGVELDLIKLDDYEQRLKKQIVKIQKDFDYIVIDCPPSLNILTINALVACNEVIVPMICDFFSLEGLSHLLKTIELVEKRLNPKIKIGGILFTMYNKRSRLNKQVEDDVRSCLGSLVYQTTIPRNVRLSEAPSHGKAAVIYDYKCSGSKAYIDLAKEIMYNENKGDKYE